MIKSNNNFSNIGSFEFDLIKISQSDLLYECNQKILICVKQSKIVLYSKLVNDVNSQGIKCKVCFEYNNLIDPIELILNNLENDDVFNKDNPVKIQNLIIDDLFTIKRFEHSMQLIQNNQVIDQGNLLYTTGILSLKIDLPVSKSSILIKNET
jgi:hypothetical protein